MEKQINKNYVKNKNPDNSKEQKNNKIDWSFTGVIHHIFSKINWLYDYASKQLTLYLSKIYLISCFSFFAELILWKVNI